MSTRSQKNLSSVNIHDLLLPAPSRAGRKLHLINCEECRDFPRDIVPIGVFSKDCHHDLVPIITGIMRLSSLAFLLTHDQDSFWWDVWVFRQQDLPKKREVTLRISGYSGESNFQAKVFNPTRNVLELDEQVESESEAMSTEIVLTPKVRSEK